MQEKNTFFRSRRAGASLGAIALGLVTLLVPGCAEWNQSRDESQTTVTAQDVADQATAEQLIGQTITIRSMPEERIGANGIIMNTNDGDSILVINPARNGFQLPPEREIPLQVTGRVETFNPAQIQSKYGIQLEPNLYSEYENRPALIAQSLALAPKPEDLAAAPDGYFANQPIAVEGELRKLDYTPNAFALYEEGWIDDVGVLVVGVDGDLKAKGTPLEEGGNVVVTGVTRPFSAELAREFNLGWNDQQIQEFQSRYTNRPVVVADGVYPSAVSPAPGN